MLVERLEASRWRNLAPLSLALGPQLTVLEGANGQGKTNLLEALYLCATGRSFRQCPPIQLVQHGASSAQVTAYVVREGVRHQVAMAVGAQGRRVHIDGRLRRDAGGLIEMMNLVAFFPEDLRIVKEGPERRRQFLDRAVAGAEPRFVAATLAYHRALRMRNALLRGASGPDGAQMATYNRVLATQGALMHLARARFVARWAAPAAAQLDALGLPGQRLELALVPGVAAWTAGEAAASGAAGDAETLAAAFLAELVAGYPGDRRRGLTQVGPHRGDLACLLGGRPARAFASQGQQRLVVLALKLAEVGLMAEQHGWSPIVLLDDVLSELDQIRSRALLAGVGQLGAQVLLSCCHAEGLELPRGATRLQVSEGRFTQV